MSTLIKCPQCGYFDTRVVYSKRSSAGNLAKRRRICLKCEHRFNTKEKPEE